MAMDVTAAAKPIAATAAHATLATGYSGASSKGLVVREHRTSTDSSAPDSHSNQYPPSRVQSNPTSEPLPQRLTMVQEKGRCWTAMPSRPPPSRRHRISRTRGYNSARTNQCPITPPPSHTAPSHGTDPRPTALPLPPIPPPASRSPHSPLLSRSVLPSFPPPPLPAPHPPHTTI